MLSNYSIVGGLLSILFIMRLIGDDGLLGVLTELILPIGAINL